MKGIILGVTVDEGVVTGDDEKRYTFALSEWKDDEKPAKGNRVDFELSDDKAVSVYPAAVEKNAGGDEGKRMTAGLFALLLGAFGAHKFYLGYKTEGWIMLLVFVFGIILLGIPSIVISVIALIEGIMYLVKSDAEFKEIYVSNKRGWF